MIAGSSPSCYASGAERMGFFRYKYDIQQTKWNKERIGMTIKVERVANKQQKKEQEQAFIHIPHNDYIYIYTGV